MILLSQIAPRLPGQLLNEVLDLARSIKYEGLRMDALTQLIPILSGSSRQEVLCDTFVMARASWSEEDRSVARAIGPNVTRPLAEGSAGNSRAIGDEGFRAEALCAIAVWLPDMERRRVQCVALDACRSISTEGCRAITMAEVARFLPEESRLPIIHEALLTARAAWNEAYKFEAACPTGPHRGRARPKGGAGYWGRPVE